MHNHIELLKAKLAEARRSDYQLGIPKLRPGQESIMVVRPWKRRREEDRLTDDLTREEQKGLKS